MKLYLNGLLALLLLSQTAHASLLSTQAAQWKFKLGQPTLENETEALELPVTPDSGISGELQLRGLFNPGLFFWNLIINNHRPVGVNFERLLAHALPLNIKDPMRLAPWKGPYSAPFEVHLENIAGLDLFSMNGSVSYYCGAPYQGQGKHIANVVTAPSRISALVGFSGNVDVHIADPVYTENSVASLMVNIETRVRGPLDTVNRGETIEFRGDCTAQSVLSY